MKNDISNEIMDIMEMFNHKIAWETWPDVVEVYSDWREIEPLDPELFQLIQKRDLRGIRKRLKDVYNIEPEEDVNSRCRRLFGR